MTNRRRFLQLGVASGIALAAGASLLMPRKANAYYSGPLSDHFDGHKFFNPGGPSQRSFAQIARLYVFEDFARWPDAIPSPHPPDKPPPEVTGSKARLVLVGHASWLIQTGGLNILIDPVWSDRASPFSFAGPRRANPPGIAFDDLPPIHAVIVTHNHYDHMDLATLAGLWRRNRPRLVTPLGNDTIIRDAIPNLEARAVDWGDRVELGNGIAAHCVPTQHWSARGPRDRHHALWASFVLETPAGKIYVVGDSGFSDGSIFAQIRAAHPGMRLAILPIGAYEPRWFMSGQHMNPAESVEAFRIVGAERALGHHWGTFQLTAEKHDQPLVDLKNAVARHSIAPELFRPVTPGEVDWL